MEGRIEAIIFAHNNPDRLDPGKREKHLRLAPDYPARVPNPAGIAFCLRLLCIVMTKIIGFYEFYEIFVARWTTEFRSCIIDVTKNASAWG